MVLARIVFSFLEKSNKTVWIVAHRKELVSQIRETIERVVSSFSNTECTDNTEFSPVRACSSLTTNCTNNTNNSTCSVLEGLP